MNSEIIEDPLHWEPFDKPRVFHVDNKTPSAFSRSRTIKPLFVFPQFSVLVCFGSCRSLLARRAAWGGAPTPCRARPVSARAGSPPSGAWTPPQRRRQKDIPASTRCATATAAERVSELRQSFQPCYCLFWVSIRRQPATPDRDRFTTFSFKDFKDINHRISLISLLRLKEDVIY